MKFEETILSGSFIVDINPVSDNRGWFSRFFCKEEFLKIGHEKEWVQMNHSFTVNKGTIRGMHFQYDPFKETKMVKCVKGCVYDVIVDLRYNSATFLKWFAIELSENNSTMIYIPEGFAHGFQTLTDECSLIYFHTEIYKPGSENGLRFNDVKLDINWPLEVSTVSERDLSHSLLDEKFKGI
jgi:dTDP-4-dehydrorhamnose 3,5-epimerase